MSSHSYSSSAYVHRPEDVNSLVEEIFCDRTKEEHDEDSRQRENEFRQQVEALDEKRRIQIKEHAKERREKLQELSGIVEKTRKLRKKLKKKCEETNALVIECQIIKGSV